MKVKCLVSTLRVLLFNLLMITLVMSVGAEPPRVISTNPPNGVVGVRPDLDAVYIIFDKPMSWPNVTPENKCATISKNVNERSDTPLGRPVSDLDVRKDRVIRNQR